MGGLPIPLALSNRLHEFLHGEVRDLALLPLPAHFLAASRRYFLGLFRSMCFLHPRPTGPLPWTPCMRCDTWRLIRVAPSFFVLNALSSRLPRNSAPLYGERALFFLISATSLVCDDSFCACTVRWGCGVIVADRFRFDHSPSLHLSEK